MTTSASAAAFSAAAALASASAFALASAATFASAPAFEMPPQVSHKVHYPTVCLYVCTYMQAVYTYKACMYMHSLYASLNIYKGAC
jgi:hypothetical protein